MKLIKENWHWGITVAWIFFIFYLWQFSGITKPKDLNSVGDFLAGAFAPLAFFWLVSGYYQQSKGLEQNSISLKFQAKELQASTEALQLQVQEMKASVEQQKIMAEFQRLEIEERHNSVFPFLEINVGLSIHNASGDYFSFAIRNISDNDARNIIIDTNVTDCLSNNSKIFPVVLKGKDMSFNDLFSANESIMYRQDILFERVIHLSYESILGKQFSAEYKLEVGRSVGSTHRKITRIN